MLNRITRKIPVSTYKIKYTEDGKECDMMLVSLSGLKTGELISIAETQIAKYSNPESKIFVSTEIEETPQGVHLYETTIVKFLEIATLVDIVKIKED